MHKAQGMSSLAQTSVDRQRPATAAERPQRSGSPGALLPVGRATVDLADDRHAAARLAALPDGSVSVVISRGALAQSADAPALLAQVQRVLRPGGLLDLDESVAGRAGSVARIVQRWMLPLSRAGLISTPVPRDLWNDLKAAGFVCAGLERRPIRGLLGRVRERLVGAAVRAAGSPRAQTVAGSAALLGAGGLLGQPAFAFFW